MMRLVWVERVLLVPVVLGAGLLLVALFWDAGTSHGRFGAFWLVSGRLVHYPNLPEPDDELGEPGSGSFELVRWEWGHGSPDGGLLPDWRSLFLDSSTDGEYSECRCNVVPAGLPFAVSAGAIGLIAIPRRAWARFARWRRRRAGGLCVWCGYSRAGIAAEAPCPECGMIAARR